MGTQTWLSVAVAVICFTVWFLSGAGYFWPVWPVIGLTLALAVHVALFPRATAREKELAGRVGTLTESRRTALEIQEAELRRVERDLHDGAQARMVSLGMNLGLAEELIEADPVTARRLLTDARASAEVALSDLRDLVRGIRPPVLADRGLEGAISALVATAPLPVEISVDLPGTPPDPVESAVYFAVAEAIANVIKHSGAMHAWVRCEYSDGVLAAVVGDDGKGGADLATAGSPTSGPLTGDPATGSPATRAPAIRTTGGGLPGVERRLATFDGTLSVVSPLGGPTIVRLTVPCELSLPKI